MYNAQRGEGFKPNNRVARTVTISWNWWPADDGDLDIRGVI